MFEALAKGFREAQNRLAGLTELNEKNIDSALKEVRVSLLEADVELGVVRRFLDAVKAKSLGSTVQTRIRHQGETHKVSAAEQFVKICHDELVEMMHHEGEPITFGSGITGIMMVGLQGSGKTTTAAKLARWLKKQGKSPLLVAADMQRPAAVDQLMVLGKQIEVPVFNIPGATPLAICQAAEAEARKEKADVIIYDTAGRLAIDEPLMEELGAIKSSVSPDNILLVIDSMIGQDAVKTAKSFNERLGISGTVLTKLDGDARGGAALSVKEVTGAPIVFVGMGETTDKLEPFRAEGMASRVLGMGDVVGLIQDFEDVVDQKQAEKDAMRMMQGEFTLEDFLNQIRMIQKMGSVRDLIEKIPGLSSMLPPGAAAQVNDSELTDAETIILSMTKFERQDPQSLIREPSRVKRIAGGSGRTEQSVGELVQKFLYMKQMMAGMGGMGGGAGGMLGGLPGMGGLARNVRRAMKSGKMPEGFPQMPGGMPPGFPGMPGMGGFPGMGMPGMPGMGAPGMVGGPRTPAMKALSASERNAKKNQRKRERDARKKGKKK
ncbi:MAG: Signal recognition particle, subunit Ffh [Polyangiaceae bacterium]|nr:Signal recognition particle, subunit Ffh [Polyangiaceae bacterium]